MMLEKIFRKLHLIEYVVVGAVSVFAVVFLIMLSEKFPEVVLSLLRILFASGIGIFVGGHINDNIRELIIKKLAKKDFETFQANVKARVEQGEEITKVVKEEKKKVFDKYK